MTYQTRLGAFGLTEDEDILICAFSFGFALYNYQDPKSYLTK